VTNEGSHSVTVYARTAAGNAAPLRTLQGAATGLSNPVSVAVDPVNNELLAVNEGNDSVTVYARTAAGNAAPLRTLQGAATGLTVPVALTLDPTNNELAVTNQGNHSVTVHARTAAGNAAPLRTLQGAATGLSLPLGVAVDPVNNELAVANVTSVTVYARTAAGNAAPLRTLQGAATGLASPSGLAVTTSTQTTFALTVQMLGSGSGNVTSNPAGINCATGGVGTCAANFASMTPVTVTATPTGGASFTGWGGDCAGFGTAVNCNLTLSADRATSATFTAAPPPPPPPPPPPTSPTAAVALNGSNFHANQQVNYQATLTPGSTPTQVDIYLGALLPDGATFLSLVQAGGGASIVIGPSPTPFLANVALAQTIVPFSYTFAGSEPAGTYFTYAGLAVAGSNPFTPANQLSLAIQPFQFSP
jgi:hypothetical protein